MCCLVFILERIEGRGVGVQLKALQQFTNGESPSLNHLVTPNPEDLTALDLPGRMIICFADFSR